MKVQAAVAHKAGAPLTIETVDLAGPRAGEVLIEVKATGICHTDEFTLSGADPEGLFPSVLGHESTHLPVCCSRMSGRYCGTPVFPSIDSKTFWKMVSL